MILLIESTIKVSLIVLFALLATALLRNRSAAVRHWMLSAAIACAAVAPMLQPFVPVWNVQLNVPAALQRQAQPPGVAGSASGDEGAAATAREAETPRPRAALAGFLAVLPWDPASTGLLAGFVWAFGACISLLVLVVGLTRLAWLAARSERLICGKWARLACELSRACGLRRPVVLLQSDHPTLLVTWGVKRPKIILPAEAHTWSADRMRVVLLHELAHIRRGDWLTQLAAEVLRAVYWFNPLVWIASRRLRQESEHACDDAVLSGGIDGPEYATHLLALARSISQKHRASFTGFPAPAMARPSSLERRFRAMLNDRLNRNPITRPARAFTTLAVIIVTILIAGFGAAQTFATFSGSIFDSTNRVIPKVTLTLTNPQNQSKYSIQSDANGRFEFVGLPPGEYQFEARGIGFATLNGVITVSGRNVQRDLALEVGSLEETITVAASRTGASSTPSRRYANRQGVSHDPGPCTVSAVGGNIRPPTKVVDVRPVYPEHLSAAGTGGVVTLGAIIGGDGYVSEVDVVSSPHPDLDAAAVEAVRQWEFTSTLLNCQPVDVRMKVTANFDIRP